MIDITTQDKILQEQVLITKASIKESYKDKNTLDTLVDETKLRM